MAVDLAQFATSIYPVVKTVGIGITIICGSALFGWYWFIVRRRKKWNANIWERKADGRLHLIDKDVLVSKKINKGKSTIYIFRWAKTECMPPPWEATYRLRGKEYCDYLRVEDDYIPIKRKLIQEFDSNEEKSAFFKGIKAFVKSIRTLYTSETEERFIYLPINNTLSTTIEYEALDYDVNMMRINSIDNIDTMFKDKEAFLQKYGTIIILTLIIGAFIVTMYLSFEYGKNIIGQSLGATDKIVEPLTMIANKIGGTMPPS